MYPVHADPSHQRTRAFAYGSEYHPSEGITDRSRDSVMDHMMSSTGVAVYPENPSYVVATPQRPIGANTDCPGGRVSARSPHDRR